MAVVELEGVWYRYPGSREWALRGVTLSIPRGRTLVTGPTGGGKSTLLRVASGAVEVYGGELRGRVERRVPAMLVPQEFDLFILNNTVWDELVYSLENSGIPRHAVAAEARRLAEELGLEGLLYRRVTELSAGERQRLAIASAVAWGARVLMLDEPLAYLDPQGAVGLLGLLSRLDFDAVVVAEHRLHLMGSWPGHAVLLAGGEVKAAGPYGEWLTLNPALGGAGLWGAGSARAALQAAGCHGSGPERRDPGHPEG